MRYTGDEEMKNKDKWLESISDRLEGFDELAPRAVWDKIEAELDGKDYIAPVSKPLYSINRWVAIAAAAALIIGVLSYSIYLFNDDLNVLNEGEFRVEQLTPLNDASSTLDADAIDESLLSSQLKESNLAVDKPAKQVKRTASTRDITTKETDVVESPTTLALAQSIEDSEKAVAVADNDLSAANDKAVKETVDKKRVEEKRRKYDNLYESAADYSRLLAQTTPKEAGSSLSFAVGNAGGFASTDGSAGTTTFLQQINIADFPYIEVGGDTGRKMVVKDGIPYTEEKVKTHKFKHKQPISFGLNYRHYLRKNLALETGLFYTYLASDIEELSTSKVYKQKFHYLGIPLNVNWTFLEYSRFSLYTTAGAAIEICVSGSVDGVSNRAKPLQFSFQGGLGGQVDITRNVGFYIEPGVSYYIKDGSDYETIRKDKPFNFNLQTGFRLTF